ncbi:hypothetical protein BD309DRAFT_959243 [Dichomitus squalens]|uniref:Uncharacterized protein n=1 Tax=Dichomitus squalens TaxID=114155 RepID=A0A4Q9NR63_9APHY|nr:hypothetical protein BD309DRAFT_959243 [Dichomitus squalens]TBU53695.1 hypothetical protein BD310DRAFT_134142 [Dichomitus squalens]
MLPRYSREFLLSGFDSKPTVTRRNFLVGIVVFALVVSGAYAWRQLGRPGLIAIPPTELAPPLYTEYHEAELHLPQHDWSKTRPGDGQRFFFVAGHVRGLGWGNALQEHLMNAYLAYRAGRIFVFDNYTWNDDGSLCSKYNGHWIPSQIPYSALIRGPIVGEPFPDNVHASPAVSRVYFDQVCPKKLKLARNAVHADLVSKFSAELVTDAWVTTIREIEDPCVEESRKSGPIYVHYETWGVRLALKDIWSSFSTSPIITHFGWSSLVERAFDHNSGLIIPKTLSMPTLADHPFTSNAERYSPIPGLLAIHVRRGDYEQHCPRLAQNSDGFVGVTNFQDMPDQFVVLPKQGGETTIDHFEHYRRRCYPTVGEIVEKVAEIRTSPAGTGINQLYIMTNGRPVFVQELKEALLAAGEWNMISSSRDLVLDWDQKFVSQAVDMLIAQRAQVFIGNGFSTLTSTAVMMRLANSFPTNSNRFW